MTRAAGFRFLCATLGTAFVLLGAARRPGAGRTIGTATVLALVLGALMRIAAWTVGDYYAWLGELPRIESVLMLLAALALVWLRPPHAATGPA